jgi:aquaporin Z
MATTKKTVVRRKTVSPKKKTTKRAAVNRSASSSVAANAFGTRINRFESIPVAALLAELLGTFVLTAIVIQTKGQAVIVMFALASIVLTIGHLSGAHVNPAITFGAWVTRKIAAWRAVGYMVAQVLGALLAFTVLTWMIGGSPAEQNPYTGQAAAAELFKAQDLIKGKEWYAFAAELLGLSLFGFAVASAIREKKEHFAAAFTVGSGLFVALLIAGSSAILNPAVATALQVFTEEAAKNKDAMMMLPQFKDTFGWALAVYVVAPFIGSAIGFLLYDLLRRDTDSSTK